jgi:hypothetical protein
MLGDLVEASAQETELPRVRSIGSQAVAEAPSRKEYMPVFRGDESPAL